MLANSESEVEEATYLHEKQYLNEFNINSGGYNGEVTPVPIPNTEVKLSRADDTWLETTWENMSLPDLYQDPELILRVLFYAAIPSMSMKKQGESLLGLKARC